VSDFSPEVCATCPRCKELFSRDDSVICPNGCYDDEYEEFWSCDACGVTVCPEDFSSQDIYEACGEVGLCADCYCDAEEADEEVEVDLCFDFDPADQLYEEDKENKNRGGS